MQKLTKEQMLSELMIKLETIDGKLDKLLGGQQLVSNISIHGHEINVEGFVKVWDDAIESTRLMTNQEFDESCK